MGWFSRTPVTPPPDINQAYEAERKAKKLAKEAERDANRLKAARLRLAELKFSSAIYLKGRGVVLPLETAEELLNDVGLDEKFIYDNTPTYDL